MERFVDEGGLTIDLRFPTGDVTGIAVAEVPLRAASALRVPRTELGVFEQMPQSGAAGVFLLGGLDGNRFRSAAVVGPALNACLCDAQGRPAEWDYALALVATDDSWSAAEAGLLADVLTGWASRDPLGHTPGAAAQGLPEGLLAACEDIAAVEGRSLRVLDTLSGGSDLGALA